ncbi:MAG TPA: acetate--CoA ligase family protein [Phenylobacterium sp.]|uniref:acetate--CoA ligase family protein n=1 Tax=Phenylobacterium sp. TaxID=1871053 RepID=UPI002B4A34CB|nr:acetate--CoA ligase family protein [Phenylobacterium sp.]HKR89602.1 acetate--CoA ligase family protein [Phenylobacterium sp.]
MAAVSFGTTVGDPSDLRAAAVHRLLHPRSVAIIGMSARAGSAGQIVLSNLKQNNFAGEVHLVGRSGGQIMGHPVLAGVNDLPLDVDLAVLAVPAAGVVETIEACIARRVGSGVVFASGFAEAGEDARLAQEAISQLVVGAGFGLVGPNCIGFTNYVDGVDIGFIPVPPAGALPKESLPTLAILAQSGGLMGHMYYALAARNLPVAYRISTGNEAGLDLADYVAYMAGDEAVSTIALYAEHIRRPAAFLEAVGKARAAGKTLVMMHTGRGAQAQKAAASHTGAMAGDYAVMATLVSRAGVMLVNTLEELIDCAEFLVRYPDPPVRGPALATTSGAFCAIAHDYCEELGLILPPLSAASLDVLRPRMPEFTPPKNPLDLTTQVVWDVPLVADAARVLAEDPAMGSVTIAVPDGGKAAAIEWLRPLADTIAETSAPILLTVLGEDAPMPDDFEALARERGMLLYRSPERALRTVASVTHYGRSLARSQAQAQPPGAPPLPELRRGAQPEWLGKKVLEAIGVAVPAGGLARSAEEAAQIAGRIGYPVVVKIQAAELAHKTEIGGVALDIKDEAGVRAAARTMLERVAADFPHVAVDGVLVEAMARKGLELVVGAKRDPNWGPVTLVGLGGILVEALHDVRLLPCDLPLAEVVAEMRQLKSAKLLTPFRGRPAPDLEAAAKVVCAIGDLMRARPDIVEIDVNPLLALAEGEGVIALDALIVAKD